MSRSSNIYGLTYNELCRHFDNDLLLNLPKTKLPIRTSAGREEQIQETAGFQALYKWQKSRSSVKGRFCVHDGPPYANGEPHMGHLLNKVLKDIICRFKMMDGYRVHFVPGWDCHGLPVELKALAGVKDYKKLDPLRIREKARKIAEHQIASQAEAFKRWGIMADWEKEFYCTFHHDYEANQLGVFNDMYEKGCIYRGIKPIYWSPSSKTALAEAELEYKDVTSSAVYFKLTMQHPSYSKKGI
ncbi:hypothetical protein LOD99_14758 [Oopsacas minuta]|uniref:isoleucine--tRNA ligase n=1 Tax=Oopsacas minuta TaxID=111878 RepID=A0AAV7KD25_9METZ|nr:hypothetical protein LOD99_14758 [Oopsacas minuta]